MNRGPIAEIDLSALKKNLSAISEFTGSKPVIAVVKADAYGHGSVEIAKKLISEGVFCLAVAYTGEARVLRDAGIDARIMVLFDRGDIQDYFEHDLIPVIHDIQTARRFSEEAVRRRVSLQVHVKIDTGMGRMGLRPETAVSDILSIADMKGIVLDGLLSHFSEADLSDRSFALQQLAMFSSIRKNISEKLGIPLLCHMANSAAIMTFPEARLDAVRPGLIMYGNSPFPEPHEFIALMTVKSSIHFLRRLPQGVPVSYGRTFVTKRDSLIGVMPVGYADGYNRLFSNNAEVLVRGMRVPVAGRVCMDLTMLDVTDVPGVSEGDEVVLLGRQDNDMITARELASRINTIPYEITTSLGSRAQRIYLS